MLIYFILAAIFYFSYRWICQAEPLPILGIYNQPGKWYWLKFHLMKFVISRRQKKSKQGHKADNLMETEFGGGGKRGFEDLESKHKLSEEKDRPIDAVFFDGANSDGWYITLGTAQRRHDIINLFFILRIPNVGTFMCPEMLTDTNVKSVKSDNEWKTEGGFSIKCLEPMRKWKLTFKGNLVRSTGERVFTEVGAETPSNEAELISANMEFIWTNYGEYFDFDQECSPTSIAHSLAIEPWSKPLFKKLKESNLVRSTGERVFTEVGAETPSNEAELISANMEFIWTNYGECFDFDQECSPTSIAHSLAIEPWSKPLFKKLKESHQCHYEQFGFLDGFVEIDKQKFRDIQITSMRDHTIASHRSWSDIRRYLMMIYHLDDGTCIHTSVISMPDVVFTQLEFGYIITKEKQKFAVDRVHFALPHYGEDKGSFPKQFHYKFEAGGKVYDAEVKLIDTVSFKMGLDQACQVNENMAEYTVNGINGRGFVELEYRIEPY